MRKLIIYLFATVFSLNCGLIFVKKQDVKVDFAKKLKDYISGLFLYQKSESPKSISLEKNIDSITETSEAQISIKLPEPPNDNFTVYIKSSSPYLTINKSQSNSIVFPKGSLEPISFTLKAEKDTNNFDETVYLEYTGEGLSTLSYPIKILDIDKLKIIVDSSPSFLEEGKSGNLSVHLSGKPDSALTIKIQSSDSTSLQSVSNISFTQDNYSASQTISISGAEDSDSDSELSVITLSATGVESASASVQIIDNDIHPVFSVDSAQLIEGNTTTAQVSLSGNPFSVKDVFLSSDYPGSIAITPSKLSFSSVNWNVSQPITIQAIKDANYISESGKIYASAQGLASSTLPITITDVDTQNILFSGDSQITEGQIANIYVKLSQKPESNTSVGVYTNNGLIDTLTFTPINYSDNQKINFKYAKSGEDSIRIKFTAKATGIPDASHDLLMIDVDTRILMECYGVEYETYEMNEGNTGKCYLHLSGNPILSRTVNFSISNGQTNALTFNENNYSEKQIISIPTIHDVDHDSERLLINANGSFLKSPSQNELLVFDLDTHPIISGANSVVEGQSSKFYITLSGNPIVPRTVNLSLFNTTISIDKNLLNFNSTNYNIPQEVNFTGTLDPDTAFEGDILSASGTMLVTETLRFYVIDSDTIYVNSAVSPATVILNEGSSVTLNFQLDIAPPEPVTFPIALSNSGALSASPAFLTFTPTDYMSPHLVTITALDDSNNTSESVNLCIYSGSSCDVIDGIMKQIQISVADKHPAITSISPLNYSSPTMTITGDNFYPNLIDNIVKFNGTTATVQSATITSLTVLIPENGTTGNVTVQTPRGIDTSTDVFTYILSVTSSIPSNGQVNVAQNSTISVTFNMNVNSATVDSSSFVVSKNSVPILGTYSTSGKTVTFTPSALLDKNGFYSVSITTALQSVGGHGLVGTYGISFYTVPDTCATQSPEVYSWGTFTDNCDGTINFVGAGSYAGQNLTWMKCSQGQVWNSVNNDCSGMANGTFQYCSMDNNSCNNSVIGLLDGSGASSAYLTCNNLGISWRVPTINELKTLALCSNGIMTGSSSFAPNWCQYGGAPINLFPNSISGKYWSSSNYSNAVAWLIDFGYYNSFDPAIKSNIGYVRCVR